MASDPFPITACASSLSAANPTHNPQPYHAPLPKLWCRPDSLTNRRLLGVAIFDMSLSNSRRRSGTEPLSLPNALGRDNSP